DRSRALARLSGAVARLPTGWSRRRPVRPSDHHALRSQRFRPGVVSLHLPQPGVAGELDRLVGRAALRLRQFCLCTDDGDSVVAAHPGESTYGFRAAQPHAEWPGQYARACPGDHRVAAPPDVSQQYARPATSLFIAELGGNSSPAARPRAATP